ncbi:hypothetical protein FRC12_001650 [Ceratobasidium sp. 428]|nr:hypothetical protein FRC12_001650 [Ceratobasidium sp. 428]
MEAALSRWANTQSHLKEAAANFLDACLTLRKEAAQSFSSPPNHVILENMLDKVQSRTDLIGMVEDCMHKSRAVLHALLNISTSRVSINKLPSEILVRIFSITVASSPCVPSKGQRDALLDIPLVCARWNQVATNHRSLWSHIDIDSSRKSSGPLRLNRARLWLERSHGVPIHIHSTKDDFRADEDTIQRLISVLQPYAMFTSSLVISGRHTCLARPLLELCLNQSNSSTLSTIIVDRNFNQDFTFSWPTYPLPMLESLELWNIPRSGCHLEDLLAILSDCPRLHTLRLIHLRNFIARSDQLPSQGAIHLPHLKLLELVLAWEQGLTGLMTAIQPGELELDVRLNIGPIEEGPVLRSARSLLGRSNVVSLTLSGILSDADSPSVYHIQSLFFAIPHLRALRVSSTLQDANVLLSALANDVVAQSLSNLQSLCIAGGEVDSPLLNSIISFVEARPLRNLFFWSCRFAPSYNEQEAADDPDEDEDSDGENQFFRPRSPLYAMQIPSRAQSLLLEYVERLMVRQIPPVCIIPGVDLSVQELIKTD